MHRDIWTSVIVGAQLDQFQVHTKVKLRSFNSSTTTVDDPPIAAPNRATTSILCHQDLDLSPTILHSSSIAPFLSDIVRGGSSICLYLHEARSLYVMHFQQHADLEASTSSTSPAVVRSAVVDHATTETPTIAPDATA
ncbi:hypothetical protein HAX54_030859 [Datura stramonium]|uniref:Uncharacterized protein n=1 Tax=Datura stramonium TaxID=4076 RepID=A0ABS8V995_DATST|nr:hypothetical protein [Datura stramonium]